MSAEAFIPEDVECPFCRNYEAPEQMVITHMETCDEYNGIVDRGDQIFHCPYNNWHVSFSQEEHDHHLSLCRLAHPRLCRQQQENLPQQ